MHHEASSLMLVRPTMTSLRKDGNVAYFPSLRSVVSFLLALWLGLIIFKRPLVGGPNVVSSLPGVVLIDHSSIVAQGSRNGARVASSWGPRAAAAAGRREPLWDDYLGPHDLVDYDYPPKRLPRDEAGPAVEALHGLTPLPAGQACLPALEKDWPSLLGKAELRAFSQNEEDGVLLGILLSACWRLILRGGGRLAEGPVWVRHTPAPGLLLHGWGLGGMRRRDVGLILGRREWASS